MQREMISARNMSFVICMFVFGSSVIMGVSSLAAQDSWISLLLAAVFVTPVLLIYARIMKLFPQRDLFEIAEALFGKILGKIIIIIMVWYSIHLCALILRNFSEFVQISMMPETPQLPIMFAIILVVAYMAKSGIETMGKWSIVMLAIIVLVVILTIILSLNRMDVSHILPIMEHGFGKIAKGAFQLYSFPFAETVVFLCLANYIKRTGSPYKMYMFSALISFVILLFIILRNLLLIGPGMMELSYFPSFTAVRILEVADFFARIEGFIAMNFILAGIAKTTVCVMAASKGISALFGLGNYRHMLLPICMAVVALAAILYEDAMQMFDFLPVYGYYAIPFQIIIPMLIWVTAEIKMRKKSLA